MKRVLLILLAAGVVVAAISFGISQRRAAREQTKLAFEKAKAERAEELERLKNQPRNAPAPLVLPIAEPSIATRVAVSNQPTAVSNGVPAANSIDASNRAVEEILTAVANLPPRKKRELQDPLARDALSLVGVDPDAEEIWAEAINNPDLPAKEREDLIEDLNEEGFPDPKNLTLDDLPLILSRLALIEEWLSRFTGADVATPMDEANLPAFMEARKDLINMAARLTQQ